MLPELGLLSHDDLLRLMLLRADDGIRTRNSQLGRLAPGQLGLVRVVVPQGLEPRTCGTSHRRSAKDELENHSRDTRN